MRHRLALLPVCLLAAATVPAAEQSVHEITHYPVAAGAVVTIDVADTDVNLRSGDVTDLAMTTELHISGAGQDTARRWITGHTPIVDRHGDGLSIRIPPAHYGFLGFGMLTVKARLDIVMTPEAVPDITTTSGDIHVRGDFPSADPLRLRTSTGDARFLGAAPSVDFRTSGGDLRVEVVRPLEKLFARTSSGNVTLSGGTRDLHVDTASGDVWANALSGSVAVETSKGKVTLRWDRLPAEATVRILNHSGKTRLVLPPGATPKGTIRTTSGKIRCSLPGTVGEDGTTVVLEGPGPAFEVTTVSGEIEVDTGEAEWQVAPVDDPSGKKRADG